MSNYILLITQEYFETLKNNKDIKLLSPKEILKESWLAIIFFVIAIILLVLLGLWRNKEYSGWILLAFVISVLLLIPITQNISQKAYERRKEVYDTQLRIFRKILSEFGLYELKKMQELIIQCDLACTEYKLSLKITDRVSNISKSIFLPLFTFASGLIVKNVSLTFDEAIKYIISTISLIITLLLFAYEIKWFLVEVLDSQSIKLRSVKGLIVDILIKDFIKEDKEEVQAENCYI